jgi:hypothetical protein
MRLTYGFVKVLGTSIVVLIACSLQAYSQPSRVTFPDSTVVWQGSVGNRCPYADQYELTG